MFERFNSLTQEQRQFITYTLIGATGVFADIASFALFTKVFGIDEQLANVMSVTLGILDTFILNLFFNFKTFDNIIRRFVAYYGIGLSGLTFQAFGIWVLHAVVGIDEVVTKVLLLPFILVIQYTLNSRISFRRRSHDKK